MTNESTLLWGLLFGSIGLGYFIYGKKQRKPIPFIVGIGLMGVPYFTDNSLILVAIGCGLMALAYFIRLG